MQCEACGYELWNIRGRTCPECGATFCPANYEFRPGAVGFDCPACGETYFGTTEKGHLHPERFHCVRCGRFMTMDDDAILRPIEGDGRGAMVDRRIPWLQSESRSFLARWWGTVVLGLRLPTDIMSGVRPNDPTGVQFMVVSLFVSSIVLCMQSAVFGLSGFGGFGGGALRNPILWGVAPGSGVTAVFLSFAMIIALAAFHLLAAYAWAGAAHACLYVLGVRRPSWRRTQQAVLFASGSVAAVGFASMFACSCLSLLAYPWWAAVAGETLARAHGIDRMRGAIASWLPAIALVVGIVVLRSITMSTGGPPPAPLAPPAPAVAPAPAPTVPSGGSIDTGTPDTGTPDDGAPNPDAEADGSAFGP